MSRKPDPRLQRRWLDLVQEWRRSGLTVSAFCRRRRLCPGTFYLWRRTLRERGLLDDEHVRAEPAGLAPAFVQVSLDPKIASDGPAAIEVVMPQGPVVRLRSRFDPEVLRQLLAVLQERAC